MQELRQVSEELAASNPVEQLEAEERSHQHDERVAEAIRSARAAYDRHREWKLRDAMATYAPPSPRHQRAMRQSHVKL